MQVGLRPGVGARTAREEGSLRAVAVDRAADPADSLARAVSQVNPAAVIIVSHLSMASRPAIEALRSAQLGDAALFYAGNAFLSAPPGAVCQGSTSAPACRGRRTSLWARLSAAAQHAVTGQAGGLADVDERHLARHSGASQPSAT